MALCLVFGGVSVAQTAVCRPVVALARIARARSLTELNKERVGANDDFRTHVVIAARLSELQPKNPITAAILLNLIPQSGAEQQVLITLGDSLCDEESLADMESLGNLGQNLPRMLARAVLLAPQLMPRYVQYAMLATQDPHNDHALQMAKVCRAAHPQFLKAVQELSDHERARFARDIFDSTRCRALTLPEAQ